MEIETTERLAPKTTHFTSLSYLLEEILGRPLGMREYKWVVFHT